MILNKNLEKQIIQNFSTSMFYEELFHFIQILVSIATLMLGVTIGVLVIVWLERKISAAMQQRIGPEYAGP